MNGYLTSAWLWFAQVLLIYSLALLSGPDGVSFGLPSRLAHDIHIVVARSPSPSFFIGVDLVALLFVVWLR
jgi:hypothetical protein